jgi:hypothetical protein
MGSGTGGMKVFNNEGMTIKGGTIGPEIGIGHYVGHATDAPVLILKSCIGNRSLGWDLLPPGSSSFEFEDQGKVWHYAGYKETPLRWEKGTEPKKINWYAGMQYDGDIARAKQVLAELDKYYPGAKKYEIAGFFFRAYRTRSGLSRRARWRCQPARRRFFIDPPEQAWRRREQARLRTSQ